MVAAIVFEGDAQVEAIRAAEVPGVACGRFAVNDDRAAEWREGGGIYFAFHLSSMLALKSALALLLLTGFHPSWSTFLGYCNVSKKTRVLKYW